MALGHIPQATIEKKERAGIGGPTDKGELRRR
jgi:hypothetical protein